MSFQKKNDFFKLMNNSLHGKKKKSFRIEKDFFKLINNSVYGKTINARLIRNAKKNISCIKIIFWDEKEAKRLFQKLPFYDELSIVKISKAFERYARNYGIEIMYSKDPLVQFEARKF